MRSDHSGLRCRRAAHGNKERQKSPATSRSLQMSLPHVFTPLTSHCSAPDGCLQDLVYFIKIGQGTPFTKADPQISPSGRLHKPSAR